MKALVITPRKTLFEGETPEMILPGEDGECSVWDFHEPALIRLRQGVVKIRQGRDLPVRYAHLGIKRGMARVDIQETTVFVE